MAEIEQVGIEEYWKAPLGAPRKFKDGDELWAKCVEYFEWNQSNPLYEAKHMSAGGAIKHIQVAKMRAMTIGGLCLFINCTHESWIEWRKHRKDLSEVITRAEAVIRAQKFEGASADLLNANIIARDLGLADKKELEVSTPDLTPDQQVEKVQALIPQIGPILLSLGWRAPEGEAGE